MWRGQSRKFLHDQIKLRKFLARESLAEYRSQRAILLCEQRQVAFRSADVARKDHRSPRSTFSCESSAPLSPNFMGCTIVDHRAPAKAPILAAPSCPPDISARSAFSPRSTHLKSGRPAP